MESLSEKLIGRWRAVGPGEECRVTDAVVDVWSRAKRLSRVRGNDGVAATERLNVATSCCLGLSTALAMAGGASGDCGLSWIAACGYESRHSV